jgi:hypothetical protein
VKPFAKVQDNGVEMHWENFIAAIRNNNPSSLHCSIEEGAHIATVAQMGNIAFRSGKKISWDATKNKFTDHAIHDEYFMKKYRLGEAFTQQVIKDWMFGTHDGNKLSKNVAIN